MSIWERPFHAGFLQRCVGYSALSGRSVAVTIPRGRKCYGSSRHGAGKGGGGTICQAHHDEMATPSKPAQKTARAVEGPRAGAAGNQARVHGERRRGAELDRDL